MFQMTHNDNGPGPGRNYGETAVITFCRKGFFFGQKSTTLTQAAPHPHPSGTELLCSINCSEKQVTLKKCKNGKYAF